MLDDRNRILVCVVVRDDEDAEQGMEDIRRAELYMNCAEVMLFLMVLLTSV